MFVVAIELQTLAEIEMSALRLFGRISKAAMPKGTPALDKSSVGHSSLLPVAASWRERVRWAKRKLFLHHHAMPRLTLQILAVDWKKSRVHV